MSDATRPVTPGSWNTERKLVLDSLARLDRGQENSGAKIDMILAQVTDLKIELAKIQIRATLFGGMAGVLIGFAVAAAQWIFRVSVGG